MQTKAAGAPCHPLQEPLHAQHPRMQTAKLAAPQHSGNKRTGGPARCGAARGSPGRERCSSVHHTPPPAPAGAGQEARWLLEAAGCSGRPALRARQRSRGLLPLARPACTPAASQPSLPIPQLWLLPVRALPPLCAIQARPSLHPASTMALPTGGQGQLSSHLVPELQRPDLLLQLHRLLHLLALLRLHQRRVLGARQELLEAGLLPGSGCKPASRGRWVSSSGSGAAGGGGGGGGGRAAGSVAAAPAGERSPAPFPGPQQTCRPRRRPQT